MIDELEVLLDGDLVVGLVGLVSNVLVGVLNDDGEAIISSLGGNGDGDSVGDTAVADGVEVKGVGGLGGEGSAVALKEEGVVILHEEPNKFRGHLFFFFCVSPLFLVFSLGRTTKESRR